jgi:hypothetical protein
VTIQLLRVIGAAAARVADATVSVFIVNVASPAVEADPSGLQLARANAESMLLLDGLARGFDTLLRHNIGRGFRSDVLETLAGVDLVRRSVGFADLVDSTAWTQQLDLRVLAQVLTRFDTTASQIVVGHGGRVVKLIGDEVLFVSDNPVSAADIGLALIRTFESDEALPPVRVGIATGEVLARDGITPGRSSTSPTRRQTRGTVDPACRSTDPGRRPRPSNAVVCRHARIRSQRLRQPRAAVPSHDLAESFLTDRFAGARIGASEPQHASAVGEPRALEDAFTRKLNPSDLGTLHSSNQLTVQHVVSASAGYTGIHPHLTWAVLAPWGGCEHSCLFARDGAQALQASVDRCEPVKCSV